MDWSLDTGSIPVISTRKRLRIGYNSESFSVKSAFVGINPPLVDEIAKAMKSALRQVKLGGFDFI